MGSTKGKIDKGKGRAKEALGDLTGDKSMKREGRADRIGGAVKEKAGDATDTHRSRGHCRSRSTSRPSAAL